ncbi:MAG: methyltransferase [Pseudomonadales bacterium]|jgi:ubiquinone/menaquinone biosynthesis C-methylase UbiE|nr:methyltransferase [Pseudomonadales bacterium]
MAGDAAGSQARPAVTEAEEISEIAFGFMASKALFAALHADLFSQLADGPLDAAAVAERTGLRVHATTTLLTALTTIGLLEYDGERWRNAPGAATFLVRGAPYDFGDYLRHQIDRQMYPLMGQLDAALLGVRDDAMIDSYAKWMADAEAAQLYSSSQHAGSLGPARTLLRRVDLAPVRHLLDVGGGTGAFSITAALTHPELEATVVDFPNVVALGRQYAEAAGVADRVRFVAGDALDAEWPQGVDALLFSYLFSSVPGDAIPGLVERAGAALVPGGRLLVHDFMVDDDRAGPRLAALWQLQHTAFNPEARSVTPAFVRARMDEAGFEDVRVETLIPGMTRLVHAVRSQRA